MLQTLQTDFMTNFQQKEKPSNILWDNGHVGVQLIFIPFLLWMSLISLTREAWITFCLEEKTKKDRFPAPWNQYVWNCYNDSE